MKFDINWDTIDAIGIEFVKESYIALLETLKSYEPDNESYIKEMVLDQQRVASFETILKYILPKGEADAFINGQRKKHIKQSVLFD